MSDVPNIAGDGADSAPDSVYADIESAWNEEEAKESGLAPPPPHYEGQPRDEQGRWTAEQQAQAEAQAQYQQGQQQDFPNPPPGWSPQAKAEYMKLAQTYPDHPIVQAVQQREAEMNAGMQMYHGLKTWVEQAQAAGKTLPEVIQNWAQAENLLATDFYQGIGWLCNYFGINPEQLIAQYYGHVPPQGMQQDPTMQYVQQLKQQVDGIRQQWEYQQNAAINQELAAFAQDHMWFDNVEPIMADIFKHERAAGRNVTLQEAYDAACWGHPETRAILIQHYFGGGQSNGQSRAPPPNQQRGSSLPPGSPIPGASSTRQSPKGTSIYQEIDQLYDELSGI